MFKLKKFGIIDKEIKWFKNYLSNRRQSVRCHGVQSEPINLDIGIPQGGVLGPDLFLIFINDIAQSVSKGTCNIFADDVIIYCTDPSLKEIEDNLQSCINSINNWYTENRLQINVSKTNIMLISSRKSRSRGELKVKLDGIELRQVNSVRYLGVEVDCNLLWENHVKLLCRSLSFKVHALRRLSSILNKQLLNTLYKTTIQPCIDYGCSV